MYDAECVVDKGKVVIRSEREREIVIKKLQLKK